MEALTDDELMELFLLESSQTAQSLIDYIPRVSPQWVAPQHLYPIAELFSRAEYEPVRACVSVPPRHGKTELILHGVSWWLHRHPEDAVVYLSYGADFASQKSKRALDIAQRAGLPLRRKNQKASSWMTAFGGGLMATGIGGPLTGHGANFMVIDDPIKNRADAESSTTRENNWDWFTSTAMTRLEPNASAIVVHTRWHDDDLIGRLVRDRDWEYINLPALANDNDPIGRQPGEALWPRQWPVEVLDARRKLVGEYDWASMFQGEPRPRGGRLFKDPTNYDTANIEARPLIVCDPAATSKNYSDYSAIVVGLGWIDPKTKLPHVDVVEVHRMQVEVPILAQHLLAIQQKWQCPVAIEAVGGFKAIPQMLRHVNRNLRIYDIHPSVDKFTRALPAAAAWNDGRIRLPSSAKSWKKDFLNEVMSFTGVKDTHDDQVDALAHMYTTFAKILPRRGHGPKTASWLPYG